MIEQMGQKCKPLVNLGNGYTEVLPNFFVCLIFYQTKLHKDMKQLNVLMTTLTAPVGSGVPAGSLWSVWFVSGNG